jgi:hypothetical protein
MFHALTVGHIDHDALARGSFEVRKPLDTGVAQRLLQELGRADAAGQFTIGGSPVRFREGCVECVYLHAREVPEALEFARRMHELTGCAAVDVYRRWFLYKDTEKERQEVKGSG